MVFYYNSRLKYFILVFVLFQLLGCGSGKSSKIPVEEQVRKSYKSYVLLINEGVNSMMVLNLKDDQVTGEISRPTEEDMEIFLTKYSENPLCQDCQSEDEIVACICAVLKEKGCIRLASCANCIYSCD